MPPQTYRPPKSVVDIAKNGAELLHLLEASGNDSILDINKVLISGDPVDISFVKRMCDLFKNNENTIDYLMCGGEDGRKWACKIEESNHDMSKDISISTKVVKVDESLGLVFGYGIICKEDGEPYYDLQGDFIAEDVMLSAAMDFMASKRVLGDMHEKQDTGSVVFAMPITEDIAKAFGIETNTTGLMLGTKPSEEVFKKFQSGEYTGFSIGGKAERVEVENA